MALWVVMQDDRQANGRQLHVPIAGLAKQRHDRA